MDTTFDTFCRRVLAAMRSGLSGEVRLHPGKYTPESAVGLDSAAAMAAETRLGAFLLSMRSRVDGVATSQCSNKSYSLGRQAAPPSLLGV